MALSLTYNNFDYRVTLPKGHFDGAKRGLFGGGEICAVFAQDKD